MTTTRDPLIIGIARERRGYDAELYHKSADSGKVKVDDRQFDTDHASRMDQYDCTAPEGFYEVYASTITGRAINRYALHRKDDGSFVHISYKDLGRRANVAAALWGDSNTEMNARLAEMIPAFETLVDVITTEIKGLRADSSADFDALVADPKIRTLREFFDAMYPADKQLAHKAGDMKLKGLEARTDSPEFTNPDTDLEDLVDIAQWMFEYMKGALLLTKMKATDENGDAYSIDLSNLSGVLISTSPDGDFALPATLADAQTTAEDPNSQYILRMLDGESGQVEKDLGVLFDRDGDGILDEDDYGAEKPEARDAAADDLAPSTNMVGPIDINGLPWRSTNPEDRQYIVDLVNDILGAMDARGITRPTNLKTGEGIEDVELLQRPESNDKDLVIETHGEDQIKVDTWDFGDAGEAPVQAQPRKTKAMFMPYGAEQKNMYRFMRYLLDFAKANGLDLTSIGYFVGGSDMQEVYDKANIKLDEAIVAGKGDKLKNLGNEGKVITDLYPDPENPMVALDQDGEPITIEGVALAEGYDSLDIMTLYTHILSLLGEENVVDRVISKISTKYMVISTPASSEIAALRDKYIDTDLGKAEIKPGAAGTDIVKDAVRLAHDNNVAQLRIRGEADWYFGTKGESQSDAAKTAINSFYAIKRWVIGVEAFKAEWEDTYPGKAMPTILPSDPALFAAAKAAVDAASKSQKITDTALIAQLKAAGVIIIDNKKGTRGIIIDLIENKAAIGQEAVSNMKNVGFALESYLNESVTLRDDAEALTPDQVIQLTAKAASITMALDSVASDSARKQAAINIIENVEAEMTAADGEKSAIASNDPLAAILREYAASIDVKIDIPTTPRRASSATRSAAPAATRSSGVFPSTAALQLTSGSFTDDNVVLPGSNVTSAAFVYEGKVIKSFTPSDAGSGKFKLGGFAAFAQSLTNKSTWPEGQTRPINIEAKTSSGTVLRFRIEVTKPGTSVPATPIPAATTPTPPAPATPPPAATTPTPPPPPPALGDD